MTPEEVESRLQLLKTPEPPELLRARCLAPQRPDSRSRMAFAIAASFVVVALAGWLILTPTPPVKPPDGILVDPGTAPIQRSDDPRLQEKVEELFRKNPGKAILVVQVRELRIGAFHPVTKGVSLEILLHPLGQESTKALEGTRADVDADGTLLFVVAPGRYDGRGYRCGHDRADTLCFTWEHKDLIAIPGDVLHLSDAIFAPWMEWSSPVDGSGISLKADPAIVWIPYPEVRAVRIGIDRMTREPDGIEARMAAGVLTRDCPAGNRVAFSELAKTSRPPLRVGEVLEVTLEGLDGDGKKLTGCKTKRRLTLKE